METPKDTQQYPSNPTNIIRQDLGLDPLSKEHFEAARESKDDTLVSPDPYTVAVEAQASGQQGIDESQILKASSPAVLRHLADRKKNPGDDEYDDDPSIMGAYADSRDTAHAHTTDGGQSPSTPWHP